MLFDLGWWKPGVVITVPPSIFDNLTWQISYGISSPSYDFLSLGRGCCSICKSLLNHPIRVISSFSISRCTWRIIAILSFVENRLRFVSNGGASSALPLVGVGCAGGSSLSIVIWPYDCAKNEVDNTMKERTGTYNHWAIRNGTIVLLRAIYLVYAGVKYVVCPVSPLSLDFGESSVWTGIYVSGESFTGVPRNCTTVDYAYSHTVLEKTHSDSDSTVLVDTDSENRFCICFQLPVQVLSIVFA